MPRKPSSIPENVRKFRPGPCTEIKKISGHYYVYSYHSIKLPSGNWGKKTDKCIGTIIPDKGFVPNKNYQDESIEEGQDEITVLEYGQTSTSRAGCRSGIRTIPSKWGVQP